MKDLVIYEKPKELGEFKKECNGVCLNREKNIYCQKVIDKRLDVWVKCDCKIPLTRPPQSYCYVEGE